MNALKTAQPKVGNSTAIIEQTSQVTVKAVFTDSYAKILKTLE